MAEHLYKVRKLDTVFSICLQHRIKFDDFIRLNPQFGELGHRHYDHLVPGEVVVISVSNKIEQATKLKELYDPRRPGQARK